MPRRVFPGGGPVTGRGRVRVALPWLRACAAEASEGGQGLHRAQASLRWLLGRCDVAGLADVDWRQWLLDRPGDALGAALEHWPAGPCRAALAGTEPSPSAGWSIAQPVHLAAGMDHLRMAPPAEARPSPDEVAELAAAVRGHFGQDEFDLRDFADDAWLVRWPGPMHCVTHDPAALAGRNVHDYMPSGPHGGRVRAVMNEIQMLLHEHPVNQRRVRQRQLPVNAFWPWGFGALAQPAAPLLVQSGTTLRTDDPWLRAFWQLHGGDPVAADATLDGCLRGDALIAVARPPAADPAAALAEIETGLFADLARAVRSGSVRALELHDGERILRLVAGARYRFWRGPARTETP